MKKIKHVLGVSVVIPLTALLFPVIKLTVREYLLPGMYAGQYNKFLLLDLSITILSTIYICYLIWFTQKYHENNKHQIICCGLMVMLGIVFGSVVLSLKYYITSYIMLCWAVNNELLIIILGIYFYLWYVTGFQKRKM